MGHDVTIYPPPMGQACRALNARGGPCGSTSVGVSRLCACHDGKSQFGTVEVARSFLKAAEEGDWRAADALMNRIYESRSRLLLPTWRRHQPSR